MASATGLKELEGATECSICTEVFTDPRVLPCVHTYCLKCIQAWCKDKCPGDNLACPLCRQESTIPDDGLEGLPRNFFVGIMLRVKDLTKVKDKSIPCDMCTGRGDGGTGGNINPASTYCLQCQENYCGPCAGVHRQQEVNRDHKLVQRGGEVRAEDLYPECPPANCDKHVSETMKLYCNDCKLVICMMCFAMDHNTHKCSDVNEVVDEFRKQMTDDVTSVLGGVEQCEDLLRKLNTEKKNLQEQVSKSEREIREKTNQLKQMLDRHEELLLAELKSIKQRRTKELEVACEEVQRQLAAMESYKKYVYEMTEKRTACDIVRAASGLRDRAAELIIFDVDVLERKLSSLGCVSVTFMPADFVTDDFSKTVGELHLEGDVASSSPAGVRIIPGKHAVYAMTSLGDRVFVVRSGQKLVEIYDVVTLNLQKRLPVPQLSHSASGIAACATNDCLYLSDWKEPSILCIDLPTSRVIKRWPVAKKPEGLSVNWADNVIVACITENKLQEYTSDGHLVREIRVKSPWQGVELPSGRYLASQFTTPGVVREVQMDGQVVQAYGQYVNRLKCPGSLCVTTQGSILVTDEDNNRVVVINASLSEGRELPLLGGTALRRPRALYLDESRDRLYVGEYEGRCRVIVINNVMRNTVWT